MTDVAMTVALTGVIAMTTVIAVVDMNDGMTLVLDAGTATAEVAPIDTSDVTTVAMNAVMNAAVTIAEMTVVMNAVIATVQETAKGITGRLEDVGKAPVEMTGTVADNSKANASKQDTTSVIIIGLMTMYFCCCSFCSVLSTP